MQYYSEKTKKLYKTIEDLKSAEVEFDKKEKEIERAKKERSEAAKKVEDARILAEQAKNAYNESLREFIKKYGSYHETIKEVKPIEHNPTKMLTDLLENWPFLF